MQIYHDTLPGGATLTGLSSGCYRVHSRLSCPPGGFLILPGGGYEECSPREADPVAVQFLQAGYQVLFWITP